MSRQKHNICQRHNLQPQPIVHLAVTQLKIITLHRCWGQLALTSSNIRKQVQPLPSLLIIRHQFFQQTPELWPVVLFLQMAKLMGDDVVDAILGRFDQFEVQQDASLVGATPPA